jgi:uncharacterized repeat protein (TIGR03803 family)
MKTTISKFPALRLAVVARFAKRTQNLRIQEVIMKPIRTVIALAVAVLFLPAVSTRAVTLTIIHPFGVLTNVMGFNPQAPLVQGPDGALYGTASGGEGTVGGVVFKIQPDGTGFIGLKYFTNSLEGANPLAGLILSSNTLYGTTASGSSAGDGTVFAIQTDGTGFTNLYSFSGADGSYPQASLVLFSGWLYGTTDLGGSAGDGTVFALRTDGTGFTNLYSFSGSDGSNPQAGLALSGNTLYGTTYSGGTGGSGGYGTVFAIHTDGSSFTNLHNFNFDDGAWISSGVVVSGNMLYGTACNGGSNYGGTVFAIHTDGTGFTNLYNFTTTDPDTGANSDGDEPNTGLILSGNTLFGTAFYGGSGGGGVVFAIQTDGTGFTNLHSFSGSDGAGPSAGLLLSSNILFGTTRDGGSKNSGTVFALHTDGTGFTNLQNFGYWDGVNPHAGLLLSGSALYGTTENGGSANSGTVFKVGTNGTGFATLYNFSPAIPTIMYYRSANWDGANPDSGLVLSGNMLYGMTQNGGAQGIGTLFKLNTDGSSFTNFHDFTLSDSGIGSPLASLVLSGNTVYGTSLGGSGPGTVFAASTDGSSFTDLHEFDWTYSNGQSPYGGLVLSGNMLYGTAESGGAGCGTIFALDAENTGYTNIYTFSATSDGTNSDGANSYASLILSGNTLYGTAFNGGSGGCGTVFKLNTDGTGFTTLHDFSAVSGPGNTNGDGANPYAGLVLSGNTLYGTTQNGGNAGDGTVFAVNTDGSGFTNLYSFSGGDGAYPVANLVLAGDTLYGTASSGGPLDEGVVFALSLTAAASPVLEIQRLGGQVVLNWNAPDFSLQSATNVAGPYQTVSGATSPYYTNALSSQQMFFRLLAN